MKKVAFYTLGCKLNFSETSTISRQFAERGFRKVEFHEQPDIYIINTCSVTENADKKCRKLIKEARKISPNAFVAIIGCYAQLKPKEISEIPGVDAVLGASEKFRLLDLLGTFERPESPQVLFQDVQKAESFQGSFSYGDRTRTFLKVQDGCNYNCAFCTIPLARGKSRSDSLANIVRMAEEIGQTEAREVVLTGVNTGDFGIQQGRREERFIDLIKALDQVPGIDRIRISSIEPNLLSEEIIEFVANSNKFVPHFHIPLQSGSNAILKAMHRRYQRELYAERVAWIKNLMPHCCIGVDVIVGFPGEGESEFMETYRFLNDLDISYLHVFSYSERPNTAALKIKPVVPLAERHKRSKMLRILSDKKRRHFYEQHLGNVHRVLFEKEIEKGHMLGFTENYIRVRAKYDPMLVNELKTLRLGQINEEMLVEVEEIDHFHPQAL